MTDTPEQPTQPYPARSGGHDGGDRSAPVNPDPRSSEPYGSPAGYGAAAPYGSTPYGSAPAAPTQPVPPYGRQAPPGPSYSSSASYPGSDPRGPSGPGSTPPAGGGASGTPKRPGRVGVLAALAIGAIVGGVAGAGVFALADGSDSAPVSETANTPANITVNDADDATIVTGVAAAAGPSIVTLSVGDARSGSAGTGSGVIISDDGYLITNTHVVTLDGAAADSTVTVQTADGRLFEGIVVGTDPVVDLAVVKIDGGDADFQPIEFADSSELNVGDTAIAIGAPLGLANTVTDGIVSALNRSITVASSAAPESSDDSSGSDGNGQESPFDFWQLPGQGSSPTTATSTISLPVIQTDAAINPGNSGGALLDTDGALVGINVAIASAGSSEGAASGSIGVGFAIPSNLAKRISGEIIESGTGTHGLLGASVDDVTTADAAVVGALIISAVPGGAAETAGITAGDVITSIGGVPVTGATDLTAQVRALAAGATTSIIYVRDGETETTEVTLGALE